LGLPIADMGLLLSAFLWAYAFSQLPGGALTDRLGPRCLLGLALFVWSLAQAEAGLVGWQRARTVRLKMRACTRLSWPAARRGSNSSPGSATASAGAGGRVSRWWKVP